MVTIKIEREFMEWIIGLLNVILKELKAVGIVSENTKLFKHKFKNRKRKSHTIRLIRDVEMDYIIFQFEVKMLKDVLILFKKVIHILIPVLTGIKSFLGMFGGKDNEIIKEFQMFKDIWKDKPVYCIFDFPEDKDKFFKGTKFIAKTIDYNEWEVVHVKHGNVKDGKKRPKIEHDMKRTTNTDIQYWINNHMIPLTETFETFEQAEYRLLNGDDSDITIPQEEFKEGNK